MRKVLVFLVFIVLVCTSCAPQVDESYDPVVDPADFTSVIDNPYFSLPVGKKMVYEAEAEDGLERIEVLVPGWRKHVLGVETLVFWDRVFVDGVLVEDTRDYLAQDSAGNVWYFGEDVDNYEDGVLKDHHGAWIAGVDGAKPGIWMKSSFVVGDEYRQEYYAGEAEDMARIDGFPVSVETALDGYGDCVKVFEWTPLDSATAYKYHCREVGGTVLEDEGDERVELVGLDLEGALGVELPEAYRAEGVF